MTSINHIDLSTLPVPTIIEELSFGDIFDALLMDFKVRNPEYDALLESDPVVIALEVAAYREVLLRQRINEAAKENMLAYATDSNLDNLAAFYGIQRLNDEDDTRLRNRTQIALESMTTAGSEQAYLYHTLSASPAIKSASVYSPSAGKVLITILSTDADGIADDDLLETVSEYVNAEERRPLTDLVVVQSATTKSYSVKAKIYLYPAPSVSVSQTESTNALNTYIAQQTTLGSIVARSGIFNALHTEGVQKVDLISPTTDIETTQEQAPMCNNITLEFIINTASDSDDQTDET